MEEAIAVDWGVLGYEESLERQRALVLQRQQDQCEDSLIIVEHPHVITLGRGRASKENVVNPGDVPVIEIERGGDVTYHGPGQVVLYAILCLKEGEQDLHRFLRNLEQGIITTLARYDIDAGREDGKTGVWIDGRKLASIGIACRKWVTFHGLALNVNTDLQYFSSINPCGFNAAIMSSVAKERGMGPVDIAELKRHLVRDVAAELGRHLL